MLAKGSSLEGKWCESAEMFILVLMLQTTVKQEKTVKKIQTPGFLFLKPFRNIFRISEEIYQNDPHANTDRSSLTTVF